jgi:CspA family cold shock protein
MGELHRGIVKWFNDAKGFGFIEHSSGKDVFVHYSIIQSEGFKTLKDGEEVDYELNEGQKGLHALRVLRSPEAEARSKLEHRLAKEKVEKSKLPAAEEIIAPALQLGAVKSAVKSLASMIEVDGESAVDDDSTLVAEENNLAATKSSENSKQ